MKGERTDGGQGKAESRAVCVQPGGQRARSPWVDTAGPGLTWGYGRLVTKEPGLAAGNGQKLCVLRGLWQRLGAGGQECVEVLQPSDLGCRKHCNSCGQAGKVRRGPTAPLLPFRTQTRGGATPCRTRGKEAPGATS